MVKQSSPLLLFDGVCNLCNRSVRFIYQADKNQLFRYQSLQHEDSVEVLNQFNYDSSTFDSIVLIEDGKLYTKSSAVLRVLVLLGFPYSLAVVFHIIPVGLRNAIYDFVARNRYRWFGKQPEVCEFDPNFRKQVWKK